jgi:hypothetical protein
MKRVVVLCYKVLYLPVCCSWLKRAWSEIILPFSSELRALSFSPHPKNFWIMHCSIVKFCCQVTNNTWRCSLSTAEFDAFDWNGHLYIYVNWIYVKKSKQQCVLIIPFYFFNKIRGKINMLPSIELCEFFTKQFNLCFFVSTNVSFSVLTLLLYLLSCILHSFSDSNEDFRNKMKRIQNYLATIVYWMK